VLSLTGALRGEMALGDADWRPPRLAGAVAVPDPQLPDPGTPASRLIPPTPARVAAARNSGLPACAVHLPLLSRPAPTHAESDGSSATPETDVMRA
jgi:hypothetical protein